MTLVQLSYIYWYGCAASWQLMPHIFMFIIRYPSSFLVLWLINEVIPSTWVVKIFKIRFRICYGSIFFWVAYLIIWRLVNHTSQCLCIRGGPWAFHILYDPKKSGGWLLIFGDGCPKTGRTCDCFFWVAKQPRIKSQVNSSAYYEVIRWWFYHTHGFFRSAGNEILLNPSNFFRSICSQLVAIKWYKEMCQDEKGLHISSALYYTTLALIIAVLLSSLKIVWPWSSMWSSWNSFNLSLCCLCFNRANSCVASCTWSRLTALLFVSLSALSCSSNRSIITFNFVIPSGFWFLASVGR